MALAKKRAVKTEKVANIELAGKNEAVWEGGIACIDTATGLVAKAFAATTLIPIGLFVEDSAAAATKNVLVELFEPIVCVWMVNAGGGEAVVAANIGGLAYLRDDQTVGVDDDTNTLSVFGRIWKIDTAKGVLVQPLHPAGQRTVSGLD